MVLELGVKFREPLVRFFKKFMLTDANRWARVHDNSRLTLSLNRPSIQRGGFRNITISLEPTHRRKILMNKIFMKKQTLSAYL